MGLGLVGVSTAQAAKPTKKSSVLTGVANQANAVGSAASRLPNLYPNWNAFNFNQIRADENAHVQFLLNALGSAARPKPNFKNLEQPDVTTFARTSYTLENTGVGAYSLAGPVIFNKQYLAAATSILTIEARHSGYLGVLLNATMDLFGAHIDNIFPPLPVLLTNAAPFINDLNGGPPLTISDTPSPANDVAILNVALALEYLEADFYNINVRKFFGI